MGSTLSQMQRLDHLPPRALRWSPTTVPLDLDDGELAGDCIWGQDSGSLRPQCHSAPSVIRNPGRPVLPVEAKGCDGGEHSLPCGGGWREGASGQLVTGAQWPPSCF